MHRKHNFAEVATICVPLIAPVIRLALLTGPTGSDADGRNDRYR